MPGYNAVFNGIPINDLERWSFNGSSAPQVFLFPRCIGALLRPSKTVTRQIVLTSQRFPPGSLMKTAMEGLQHDLNECLISQQNATLTVDGVTYTDVTPVSISQDSLSTNDHLSYSITFDLSKDQTPFEPELVDGRVRDGFFIGYEDAPPTCGFPIFDNYEAAISVSYALNQKLRIAEEYGREKAPIGGVETIVLNCWMVEQTSNVFQKYIADYLFGPLGKIGTLNLNGLVFDNAILTSVTSETQKGAALKYTLTFETSLQC
jgi:hypothetical protein